VNRLRLRRPRAAILLGVGLAIMAALLGCGLPVTSLDHGRSGLRTIEAGSGAVPFVLIHGYGSTPAEWIPFTYTIRLPAGRRFVLPEGPETTEPPDGPRNGRAWWRLRLDAYRRAGDGLPDLSRTNPPGLAAANARIRTLLAELADRGGYARDQQMLAGFSQGAMIAADVAFTTDEPIDTLVLLSPTFVNEPAWRAGMPRRRGLRVFISHGRRDGTLPFDASARLQQAMRDAGLRVTWLPFEGDHDMPVEVVSALNGFLAQR
jgi:phospholipase/carboxylesterase